MTIERITVTMEKTLLARVDALVDGRHVKNRSQAVGDLLSKALENGVLRKALVLAGGNDSGKTLTDVAGKTVLQRVLEHLRASGIRDVVIALGKNGEKTVALFKNGEALGLSVSYSWGDGSEGTAGAIAKARQFFGEPFLLSYSDVLYDELDLRDLFDFHKKNGGLCTLALADVRNPTGVGVARLSGSRIINFEEKPHDSRSNLVNAGVAICEPAVLSLIRDGMRSFEKDVLPLIAAKEKLFGYAYSGEWFHVEDKKQLDGARRAFARR